MRSGPICRKKGMIKEEMNIQEDLLPSETKKDSLSMKENTKE
jgi:hypothetical protein